MRDKKTIGNSADKAGICVIGYMGAADSDYCAPRFFVVRGSYYSDGGRHYSNFKSEDFDTD